MYHTPIIIQKLFPGVIWRIPNSENKVFLTFDDGPDPEGTPRILDILAKYDAKATFFCLGRQVEKYPTLFERILKEGHAVGNHTYSHLNGWTTANEKYFEDIERANEIIGSRLFRPPYGRIKPTQIRALKENYKIVMWDIVSGDYRKKFKINRCLKNVENFTSSGSIILLHDTHKYFNRNQEILTFILINLNNKKFSFNRIEF